MIERWEFPAVRDAMVFNSREDVEEYLARVASGSRAKAATVMAAQARSWPGVRRRHSAGPRPHGGGGGSAQ